MPTPGPTNPQDHFVTLLTGSQIRIYSYILSLLGDRDQARDVLQQTNLVLWQKASEFTSGTDFIAWAFRVAYFEVRGYRRDLAREKVVFDDDLLDQLQEEAAGDAAGFDARREALIRCVAKLPPDHRELIRLRYAEGRGVSEMQPLLGKPAGAIANVLHRIRAALLACIRDSLLQERG